jgi:hypothetical protein
MRIVLLNERAICLHLVIAQLDASEFANETCLNVVVNNGWGERKLIK